MIDSDFSALHKMKPNSKKKYCQHFKHGTTEPESGCSNSKCAWIFLHKSTFFRRLFEFPRKFCWVIVKRFQHETTFLGLSYMKLVFETVDWGSFAKALQYDN